MGRIMAHGEGDDGVPNRRGSGQQQRVAPVGLLCYPCAMRVRGRTVKLLVATQNPGKVRELRDLLADLPIEVTFPPELGLDLDVEETGATFAENATLKAQAFARVSGLLTLADDSGLEVDVLWSYQFPFPESEMAGRSCRHHQHLFSERMNLDRWI